MQVQMSGPDHLGVLLWANPESWACQGRFHVALGHELEGLFCFIMLAFAINTAASSSHLPAINRALHPQVSNSSSLPVQGHAAELTGYRGLQSRATSVCQQQAEPCVQGLWESGHAHQSISTVSKFGSLRAELCIPWLAASVCQAQAVQEHHQKCCRYLLPA